MSSVNEELNRIRSLMKIQDKVVDIIITIPQTIKWEDYQKELDKSKKGEILNFKVPFLPKNITLNKSKCYICYQGNIIGYHYISGLVNHRFKCTTTGKQWDGNFIQRTGEFHLLDNPIPHKGFRNFKYYNI